MPNMDEFGIQLSKLQKLLLDIEPYMFSCGKFHIDMQLNKVP